MFRTSIIVLACATAFAFAVPASAQMSDENTMGNQTKTMPMKKKMKHKMYRKHSMKKSKKMSNGQMMQKDSMRGASRSQIMNEPLEKTNNVD